MHNRNKPLLFFAAFLALFFAAGNTHTAEHVSNLEDPLQVIQAYLGATYGDFVEAYRFISAADRKVRNLDRYVQQRDAFSGFALEIARKLSESVEIKPQQQKQPPTEFKWRSDTASPTRIQCATATELGPPPIEFSRRGGT